MTKEKRTPSLTPKVGGTYKAKPGAASVRVGGTILDPDKKPAADKPAATPTTNAPGDE